ncbi:MAG: putative peptidoglycan glycosyl transferase, Ftsi [Alphaproteobacteria bacterium]|nr:putative peptidoglycan glycosyl transferase, Ftsi [Alphaproteobacteria bacterium]
MRTWVNAKIFGFDAVHEDASDQSEWIAGKAILKKTRSRIFVLMCGFCLAYLVIIGRMTNLTLSHQAVAEETGILRASDVVVSNVKRADVMDREGKLLATSLKTSSLYADPKFITNAPQAAQKLLGVFPDLDYHDVLKKLESKRRFVWLKRNLTPKQIYAANRLGIPGVDFLDETRRVYPYGALTSHVVGYADVDGKGLSGLERGMEGLLRDGKETLHTTIDTRMQYVLQREIKKSIDEFQAIGGAGLIMDARNGEIYAMASLPDFNPHEPGHITDAQRFNRITLGAYEMGSTFKTFTMAAAIEFLHMPLSTRFDTTHSLYRSGFTIHDFHPEPHPLSVPEIFIHSSNIGTALIAEKIGTTTLKKFYSDLGFFDKPSIEIKETASPILPRPWRDISTITAAYGHGIAVTPLHLASAVATMVNGGYKIHPTLIRHSAETYANEERKRIISEETSATMRNLLRVVVTDGTASKANATGYRVGAKTGTAEKTLGHGYSANAQIASLVAAFPVDDPRFIVMIMIDEPKGNKKSYGFATAGWVAAPYVGNVISEIAPIAGIAPRRDETLPEVKAAMGLGPPVSVRPSTFSQPVITSPKSHSTALEGGRLASF